MPATASKAGRPATAPRALWTQPAVVLRLRGRTRLGATLIEVLDEYEEDLAEVGGRLYLTGLTEVAARQLRLSHKLDLRDTVHLIEADPVLGAATERAVALARAWLEETGPQPPRGSDRA